MQDKFKLRHQDLLDASTRCFWPLVSSNRWLSIRIEFLGNGLVFLTAVASAVLLPQRYPPPPSHYHHQTYCNALNEWTIGVTENLGAEIVTVLHKFFKATLSGNVWLNQICLLTHVCRCTLDQ